MHVDQAGHDKLLCCIDHFIAFFFFKGLKGELPFSDIEIGFLYLNDAAVIDQQFSVDNLIDDVGVWNNLEPSKIYE